MRFLFAALCLAFWVAAPLPAAAQIKDSTYFMMDDGEQSPEEMEEEALYVYDICSKNGVERVYFDCQCLAGAFLIEREKEGPRYPQEDIIDRLTTGPNATCANPVAIAGETYTNCMRVSTKLHALKPDNEGYCTCVANRVAAQFSQKPNWRLTYINAIKSNAMEYCGKDR